MPSLTEIANWAVTNPVYALGALFGLALGIFYGFDGWRGSVENVEFKNSPRVKNLLWVLGGAFSALIADIRAVDASAKKPDLLLAYFAAFLAGALFVILGWGLIVAVSTSRSNGHVTTAYNLSDALGDYFYFGYRKYRDRKDSIIAKQRADFHGNYLEQLSYSITIAGSNITGKARITVARNILRSMAAVVRDYRGINTDSQIRTNLMLVRSCTDELKSKLQFSPKHPTRRCLQLMVYDGDEKRGDLVIPIPDSDDLKDALPGAPRALLGETEIIDDTNRMQYSESIPAGIKSEMKEYFASKSSSFKSFASLPVVGGGKAIAVVNIESSENYVFGKAESDRRGLAAHLFPFCSSLGILFAAEER